MAILALANPKNRILALAQPEIILSITWVSKLCPLHSFIHEPSGKEFYPIIPAKIEFYPFIQKKALWPNSGPYIHVVVV